MASHLEAAFSADRQFRLSDDAAAEAGSRMIVHEIRPGFVLDRNGVRVTTIEVDHSPVRPVYGYRIDYAGHWVVLSGDTRFSEAVIAAATDADLLVHEVAATFQSPDSARRQILRVWHHTNPAEAGPGHASERPLMLRVMGLSPARSGSPVVQTTRGR